MKLATWNINSIRAREARLVGWLDRERPDILCLQETKVEDAGFPVDALRGAGYEVAIYGQRSYNGVAIAVRVGQPDADGSMTRGRTPITQVVRGLGDGERDDEARLIAATVAGIRVVCVYVPNGQDLASEKFPYKLAWYQRLRRFLERTASPDQPLVVCGDMNVTADDRDVCAPDKWRGQIHCSDPERAALAELVGFGLVDVFRKHHPDGGVYSWWDYRGVAFFKNQGLRIDYIFATPAVAERCTSCRIDRDARKGQDASDHAPV
ncbi:MAG: exodeoxyribonuclease III, partial [Acidobacteriota bacterium]